MASLKARLEHSITPIALRSYLAEFISTFLFVFAAVGANMSTRKMTLNAESNSSSLVAIAIANAFALSVVVYIAANISGGHVNPAVTFGMAIGGHITIPMTIFYWIAQIFGSVMACLLLKTTIVGQHIPVHTIQGEMTGFGASILEGVMTFALVYTVYASADPRNGPTGAIGPLAIGLIAGANVLASGPFTGGSMNPACSFGAALIGGSFKNQAVYWVGPLIGAGIAGILYENVVFPAQVPDSSDGHFNGVRV
ncbi:Aquaporin (major intrinsic protein family) [Handroanthus impetiginosus]|uniref:Aquaporin (Major intrinsic protein family) n=1 Tax=Handroanthus impetiginosus TaxID=429701 RepID=A0A2G9I6S3_9LAMI|nr:Aquaporin (major intrinsic protein family) [Handroanthus impetiginosus]